MRIFSCKNAADASRRAAEALEKIFYDYKGEEFLFLTCGGSGIGMLSGVAVESLTNRVTIGVLDSRLDTDETNENYYQLSRTVFFRNAKNKGTSFLDISSLRMTSLSEAGKRFSDILTEWIAGHKEAKIIASIGMGPDGHIAGMMPFPDNEKTFRSLFVETDSLAVAYETPNPNQFPKRLTATYPFLLKIDNVVSYITGENKRQKLIELKNSGNIPLHKFPGAVLKQLNDVSIFTDQIL